MGTTTIESPKEDALSYDLENKQTRQQLELMDELHKLGVNSYVDLPQLVVVGDQNTGKSSVLQAVTEIPFQVAEGLCTRFATEIVLKRTSDKETRIKVEIIPAADEDPDRKRLLMQWQPEGIDTSASLTQCAMKDIYSQAEDVILRSPRDGFTRSKNAASKLSNSTLRITRSGPNETNFAVIDVPGLVRDHENEAEDLLARNLVKKYLANRRSIVVVVIDEVDLQRQGIFQLLKGMVDEESRVIGVINKCDRKQKGGSPWILDLIRNNDRKSSPRYLKEGWYGLRNRAPSERELSDDERDDLEEEFFAQEEWNELDSEKLGRHKLKKALIRMRNRHVKNSIPELLTEIERKLDECSEQLNKLGKPRNTDQEQFIIINSIATKYSLMANAALDGHYEMVTNDSVFLRRMIRGELRDFEKAMIRGGLKRPFQSCIVDAETVRGCKDDMWVSKLMATETYAWIKAEIENYRAIEDEDEVNPPVKNKIWKHQTSSWKQIAIHALDRIRQAVENASVSLFEAVCPDKDIRVKLQVWLQDEYMKASENARLELQRILADETDAPLFTLQPSRSIRKTELHALRIDAITATFKERHLPAEKPYHAPGSGVNAVPAEVIVNSIIKGNAELQGILNTHDSLAAYYDVALYRFIDNFALQVIERHLLGPNGPLKLFNSDYVASHLCPGVNTKTLNELAGEDPAVTEERNELEKKKSSLEESRKKVQNFRVL